MTGTLLFEYVGDLTTLTTIPFAPDSILCGSHASFAQREIRIKQTVTNKGNFVINGLADVVQYLIEKLMVGDSWCKN